MLLNLTDREVFLLTIGLSSHMRNMAGLASDHLEAKDVERAEACLNVREEMRSLRSRIEMQQRDMNDPTAVVDLVKRKSGNYPKIAMPGSSERKVKVNGQG